MNNGTRTPLMWAAENGHIEVVDLLIQNGADVNASDRDGGTAITRAARGKRTEVTLLLVLAGATMDSDMQMAEQIKKAIEEMGAMAPNYREGDYSK